MTDHLYLISLTALILSVLAFFLSLFHRNRPPQRRVKTLVLALPLLISLTVLAVVLYHIDSGEPVDTNVALLSVVGIAVVVWIALNIYNVVEKSELARLQQEQKELEEKYLALGRQAQTFSRQLESLLQTLQAAAETQGRLQTELNSCRQTLDDLSSRSAIWQARSELYRQTAAAAGSPAAQRLLPAQMLQYIEAVKNDAPNPEKDIGSSFFLPIYASLNLLADSLCRQSAVNEETASGRTTEESSFRLLHEILIRITETIPRFDPVAERPQAIFGLMDDFEAYIDALPFSVFQKRALREQVQAHKAALTNRADS